MTPFNSKLSLFAALSALACTVTVGALAYNTAEQTLITQTKAEARNVPPLCLPNAPPKRSKPSPEEAVTMSPPSRKPRFRLTGRSTP